jgi:hypothetical protein
LRETNTSTYFPRKSLTTMAICVNVILLFHLVVGALGKKKTRAFVPASIFSIRS